MTVNELAQKIGAKVIGDGTTLLEHAASLESATHGQLSAYLSPQWRDAARKTNAAAVIVASGEAQDLPTTVTRLVSTHPRLAWGQALRALYPRSRVPAIEPGIHPSAVIDPTAVIAANVSIGPLVYIGPKVHLASAVYVAAGARVDEGSIIGARSALMPNVVVIGRSQVGEDVWIGPGAVIGSAGFGLDEHGRLPHVGTVSIGDRTTIGANTCIDRATVDCTEIGDDCHIDNLVQIGHNVTIGHGVVICGQVGIAGGASIGDAVVIGGQAGVTGHISIAKDVRIAAQSGVTQSLETGGSLSGHPAEPNRRRLKRIARLKKLVE